jgi:hypothetical protein
MKDLKVLISDLIMKHIFKHGLDIDNPLLDDMISEVLNGVYAFNLLYNDNYQIISFNVIDYKKVLFKPASGYLNSTYSYDNGKRYQWFEKETLLIDASLIRNFKLKELGI